MNTNAMLRKVAILVGLGLLGISIFWSQDGFNFDLAGTSSDGQVALFIGWFMAFAVTAIQFVFSTSYNELNASLKLFGILAYVYSIYTNYWGIMHFQGWTEGDPSFSLGVGILSFVMDGVPEPLIAWGMYESLKGDFIGNFLKVIGSSPQRGGEQPRQVPPQQPQQYPQQNREARHAQLRQQGNVPDFLQNRGNSGNKGGVG